MNDKYIDSGHQRVYGFVEMPSKSEGEAAIISLKGKALNGQVIDVIAALPLSAKKDTAYIHCKRGSRKENGSEETNKLSRLSPIPETRNS